MLDSTFWICARGTSATTVTEQFSGLMDEIKVHNYILDLESIVGVYNESHLKNFCVRTYPDTVDVNGDCKVDLADFADLAAGWLECGLYPNCP